MWPWMSAHEWNPNLHRPCKYQTHSTIPQRSLKPIFSVPVVSWRHIIKFTSLEDPKKVACCHLIANFCPGTRQMYSLCKLQRWAALCNTLPTRHSRREGRTHLEICWRDASVPALSWELYPGVREASYTMLSFESNYMKRSFMLFNWVHHGLCSVH